MSLVHVARFLAVVAIAILLTLMIGPFGAAEAGVGISDKIGHVAAFWIIAGALAVLAPGWNLERLALVALIIGVGVEIVQGFVGRDADVLDVAADMVGIALACLTLAVMPSTRFRPKARA